MRVSQDLLQHSLKETSVCAWSRGWACFTVLPLLCGKATHPTVRKGKGRFGNPHRGPQAESVSAALQVQPEPGFFWLFL